MKKNFVYAIVLVIVSLIAGVIIGLTLAKTYRHRARPDFSRQMKMHKSPDGMMEKSRRPELIDALSRRLNLTDEQEVKIKEILEASHQQAKEIGEATKEKFIAIKEKTNAKIKEVLTPKQKEEFDNMLVEFRNKLGKDRDQGMGKKPQLPPRE